MKLLSLTLKNILENKWRSLSLGSLIFCAAFLIVLSSSAFMTMKRNMETALIDAVLGEVQLRPDVPDSDPDVVSATAVTPCLSSQAVALIEKTVRSRLKLRDYTQRVDHHVVLVSDTEKSATRIIGLNPRSTAYQNTFQLTRGRYLDPHRSGELLLTAEQAQKLKVDVGAVIGVISQTRDGYNMDSALTLVGIGNFALLSTVSVAYTDLEAARELVGFAAGEASDVILYTSDPRRINRIQGQLREELQKTAAGSAVKITTYRDIKSFELSGISVYIAMFYIFVLLLLLIVGILIINLIYMIGIERRQEIGTMRAIGFGITPIMGIFVGEIFLITACFTLAGVLCGTGLLLYFSKAGIVTREPLALLIGKQFFVRFDAGLILAVLVLLPCFAVAASLFPAFRAAALKPVDTLKEN
jgi:putative ABC transport system permease protein